MQTANDIDLTECQKVLIYSKPGVGKTELAAQWPDPVFVDCDKGMKTIANRRFKSLYPDQRVRFETFRDEVDSHGLFTRADGFWNALQFVNDMEEDDSCETIVIDSLTTLQGLAMNVGLELSGQGSKPKSLSLINARKTGKIPIAVPTQADYGSSMAAFEQFMDGAVYSVNKTVVFLAHERVDEKNGVTVGIDPLLIGSKIRAKLAAWFDEVWHLQVDVNGDRILHTQPYGLYRSIKSRMGLPDEMENPTYAMIQEALNALN